MKNNKKIWLSHSALGSLDRCPRCFWLQYNKKISQPEGITSRLPNRFDAVLKNYFSLFREKGSLPPLIEGKIEGKLENPFKEVYFYGYNEGYGFYGKLDECLVSDSGKYTPVDFKTSSSDPRKNETLPAYQDQMNAYAFLLEENNKKTTGFGHLIYVYPDQGSELHRGFPMIIHIVTLKTNPESAKDKFLKAIEVLEKDMPGPSPSCPFCSWHEKVGQEFKISD